MMYNSVFYILIAIIVFGFVFEKILDYLNLRFTVPVLPPEVADVYDSESYSKSQAYKRVNIVFSFITSSFSTLLILIMLVLGGFGWINNYVSGIFNQPVLVALMFFGIIAFASDIISTPFSLYQTFVIEEKFGFNKTTLNTFIGDKLKGYFLSIILGGGILSLIIWFYGLSGDKFWILAWLAISIFSLFMMMFYSQLIVPLFNKQTPLEEGELKEDIRVLTEKTGFRLENVYVIDGSKRSSKANAYFTGLGSKKRIVLYDTLIKDLNREEILAVLAHEIGHYKKKHTLTGTIIGIVQTGITLFIFSLFIENQSIATALNVKDPNFHISVIAFGILYSPVSMILGILTSQISRHHEYQADRFAAENYSSVSLISGLKRLSGKNLSNLTPHPLYVFFHYSHPTLLQRIKALSGLL